MNLSDIQDARHQFEQEYEAVNQAQLAAEVVEQLRIKWVGRKGKLPGMFAQLKQAESKQKSRLGQELNEFKQDMVHCFSELASQLHQVQLRHALAQTPLDVTLPVAQVRPGSMHPVSLMRRKLLDVFRRFGYQVFDGPELETDYYNFQALNIPPHHPARAMQDSFYVTTRQAADHLDSHSSLQDVPEWVLRTQSSNVQIHVMENHGPPIRMIAPGRVFRVDNDPTHTPLFHQLEGLVMDRSVSVADLKGTIEAVLAEIFGANTAVRLRPSYFPFVEPGLEIDLKWQDSGAHQTRWLEVGGCGMVHPNVVEMVGYDSEEVMGFAFGFGIDRLAMLKYGLTDLRQLFSGDVAWLSQFSWFR